MKKLVLVLLLSAIIPNGYADTKVTVGGTVVRDTSSVATLAFDHSKEYGLWQHALEGNYIYNEKNNIRSRNEGFFSFKENYALHDKGYAIGWLRYDTDEFRNDSNRTFLSIGYGYKLLRTDTTKISNEISVGQMHHNLGWQDVITNSLWISHKVAKRVTFVNKFLIDFADQQYVRNKTELNYQFDEGIILGVSNLYTKDPVIDNVTTFNIGTSF
jgi:putative salt-induced outer membrane protein YdiY